ncbi:hypothetical protein PMY73_12540 [Clostridium tertium]|uniref:hypothetical protein n=1 Tax=Clostridium TaxID=1485 RepID=UPI001DB613F9|nr:MULTISPECIES: hypothetical protein [Clostridium]MBS5306635.1 hypothetical protein [Clostridium sp.]MDB1944655.1 hypothetical protein [Clostridium tertium]MDB1952163.1 hypothetical protein [Clostridium tertium]
MGKTKFIEQYFKGESIVLEEANLKNFWYESMKNITIGFMFTLMTFDFFYLQYMLPSIGAVLLYIGFHNLRKANKDLNLAWIFSIINMIFRVLNLIYLNTPLNVNVKGIGILAFVSTVFQLSFLVIFRLGLKKIFQGSGVTLKKDVILRIIIWRIVIIICALTELGQIWVISIPIIIYYFYIFRSLYKLSYDAEAIIYIDLRKIEILNKKKLIYTYMLFSTFVVGVCCVFSNHISLDSSEVISVKEFGIRNTLIDKGIPIEIVKDIEDEDISKLKNLINIEYFSEDLKFNSILNDDGIDFQVTTIFFELYGNEMYAIEYFNWGEEGPYWQDGFEISNTRPLNVINGKLLYEKDGVNYSAEIPRLNGGMVTSRDIFRDERQEEKITGAINYPYKSQKQRGYIFYKIDITQETLAGTNLVNYMHYNHPFRIPYTEPEKKSIMFSNNLRQHGMNFSTNLSKELFSN